MLITPNKLSEKDHQMRKKMQFWHTLILLIIVWFSQKLVWMTSNVMELFHSYLKRRKVQYFSGLLIKLALTTWNHLLSSPYNFFILLTTPLDQHKTDINPSLIITTPILIIIKFSILLDCLPVFHIHYQEFN